MLKRARITGAIQIITELYTWRNGTVFDEPLRLSKSGFFPGAIYQFIDLERAIGHMKAYGECVCNCSPELANMSKRFLPVFWDGATNWIGIDLDSTSNRVVMIRYFVREASFTHGHYEPEIHENQPPREAYKSFEEFVADAIRANRENSPLTCFQLK